MRASTLTPAQRHATRPRAVHAWAPLTRSDLSLTLTLTLILTLTLTLSACGARVRPLDGSWHTVQEGDTLSALAATHKVPLEDLIELNALEDPSRILVGQRLFVPSRSSVEAARRAAGSAPRRAGRDERREEREEREERDPNATTRGAAGAAPLPVERVMALRWPLSPEHIDLSSPFGERGARAHKGLDLRAPEGTPTQSVLDGVVSRVAFDEGGYGWYVVVDHGGGLESRYAHHSKNLAREGQRVTRGERLGLVGSTGRSSGPHLHLELRYQGEPLDPLIYLPALPARAP